MNLWDGVVGQPRAVEVLSRSLAHPVHAYLFVGPPGTGKRHAAYAFAAGLLCGCGECRRCEQAKQGNHVDLVVVERAGPFITVDQAHEITRVAALAPTEGRRKVLVLVDFHLAERAVPALLKTIEEPPASTVFVILADHVPPELVTIASRCVRVDFPPLGEDAIADALMAEGVAAETAAAAAQAAGGRMDRARLLATDPLVSTRREAWAGVPARLDGTGATVALIAGELLELVQPPEGLAARQAAELTALEERAARTGERITGRKEIEDRHKREQRRARTDELRFGLAALGAAYRDRASSARSSKAASAAIAAAAAVHEAGEALIRNPNEALLLQALLLRLTG